jgi:hypothetical protein
MKRVPLLVYAAIVAVAIGPWLWWWSSLPDPVASHWDIHGRANGHLAPIVLMLALGGVATVLAVSAAGTARHGTALPRPASGASVLAFVGGMLAVASLASVLANRDATSWHTAHLSAAWVIGAFAFGVVAALANGLVQPKASAGANTSHPAVTVGPTERVGWIGRSSARWVIALAVALVILGVV